MDKIFDKASIHKNKLRDSILEHRKSSLEPKILNAHKRYASKNKYENNFYNNMFEVPMDQEDHYGYLPKFSMQGSFKMYLSEFF